MRHVFFSFDWDDAWRAFQVRNSWVPKGNTAAGFVDSADVEKVKRQSPSAIEKWIDAQLHGTSVTCVLIGAETYTREYVKYEIQKSIDRKNGLMGIYIHQIHDCHKQTGSKGKSPFRCPPFNFKPIKDGNIDYPCCSYYDWIGDDGFNKMNSWIESAYQQSRGT